MTWGALRYHNYRLFFVGQLASQTGRWMQGLAQAWLVLDLTGSSVALGTVAVAQFLPIVLFSLFSGPIADRFPKRRFLMATQTIASVQAVVSAALVLTGTVELWEIYVLAAILGTFNAIDNPTRQSFVNDLVDRPDVANAVGLNATIWNVARVVGPSIGGIIIATWGTGWCFAINAAGFALALVCLALMREAELRPPAAAAAGRIGAQVREGLRYVAGTRELLVPLALLGVIGAFGYNWQVNLPLLARFTFAVGPTGLGAMNAALGLGSIAGGLLVASRKPLDPPRLVLVAVAFSLAVAAVALTPVFPLTLVVLPVAGCLGIFFSASVSAMVQLRSRPEFRGRVLGLFFLAWAGGVPAGAALTGYLAAAFDVRSALLVSAGLCLAASAAALLLLRRRV